MVCSIWCTVSYILKQTLVPCNVARSIKLRGAQRASELALRSTEFRSPENLIFPILTGVNDLQNNCNIVKKSKRLVSAVIEADKDNFLKIAFSSKVNREDKDFKDQINDVNNKLKNCCNSAGIDFIDNSNIDGSCLNRGNLHLNRKGTAAVAINLCRFARSLPVDQIITGCEGAFKRHEVNSLDNHSDVSEMKNVHLKNPKNIIFSYLNINSVRNNFENMFSLISKNVVILIVAETKIDSSFPRVQFLIPSFYNSQVVAY